MPDIEIDRVERLAQVPFRIVIEAAAVELFVAVSDGPFDDVVEDPIIQVKVECDRIIESDVIVRQVLALDHAQAESDESVILMPKKKADLIGHTAPDFAQEFPGEFLELQR